MRLKLTLLGLLVAGAALAQQMPWAGNYEEAKVKAAEKKALIMVDFFTEW